ncbi:MAG: type II toxin-antitoxin system RelE/ParE family toxin [Alphaproteobacteria bacterium]
MAAWRVSLAALAEADLRLLVEWSVATFGSEQAERYRAAVVATAVELTGGPDLAGSRRREDLRPGLRSIHVARHGRRGRHLLMYRIAAPVHIEVLRILHDAMDLPRHVGPTVDPEDPAPRR